ncbi:hypothetical protein TL16_g00909 [Triparma laevis f. inornata]|uniref:CSD domain-containing protein n=1 Tax=Triparma laevis f. inornata TaxID=1714386 RepID=A0A9W6ZI39_9STRA|nr:hypothetical protein TL16_g00909 [Triparma laevis f. inornata]
MWTCPICSNKNYLFRSTCNRKSPLCSTPRPPFITTNKYHLDNISYYTNDRRADALLIYIYDQDTTSWKESLDIEIFEKIFKGLATIESLSLSSSPSPIPRDQRLKNLSTSLTLHLKHLPKDLPPTPSQISSLVHSLSVLNLKLIYVLNKFTEDVERWMREGSTQDVALAAFGMQNFGRHHHDHNSPLKKIIHTFFNSVDAHFPSHGLGVLQHLDIPSLCSLTHSFGSILIPCPNINALIADNVIADKIVKEARSSYHYCNAIQGLTELKHLEGVEGLIDAIERKESEWEIRDLPNLTKYLAGAAFTQTSTTSKLNSYLINSSNSSTLKLIASNPHLPSLSLTLKSIQALPSLDPKILKRISSHLNSNPIAKNINIVQNSSLETLLPIISATDPTLAPNLYLKICSYSPPMIKVRSCEERSDELEIRNTSTASSPPPPPPPPSSIVDTKFRDLNDGEKVLLSSLGNPPQKPRKWPKNVSASEGKQIGQVKRFDVIKGFGFLTPLSGGEDVFVHKSSVSGSAKSGKTLMEGEEVEFAIENDDDNFNPKAVGVCGPNGEAVQGVTSSVSSSSVEPLIRFVEIIVFKTKNSPYQREYLRLLFKGVVKEIDWIVENSDEEQKNRFVKAYEVRRSTHNQESKMNEFARLHNNNKI